MWRLDWVRVTRQYLHKTEDIIVTLPADTVRCDTDTPQTRLRSKHFTIQTTHLQTFNKHISQASWSVSYDKVGLSTL